MQKHCFVMTAILYNGAKTYFIIRIPVLTHLYLDINILAYIAIRYGNLISVMFKMTKIIITICKDDCGEYKCYYAT